MRVAANRGANDAIARRRGLERIRLLCQSGAGLEGIAGPLCHAIRDLIGAESASIFWLNSNREPKGFYHDCAPTEIKDIFTSRLDEHFTLPHEFNLVTLAEQVEPSIGRLLAPESIERFWAGNVYAHLCEPLGHPFLLDMRVDVEGIGSAVICLWNGFGSPFHASQANALRPVQRLIAIAIQRTDGDAIWRRVSAAPAQFMTDIEGETLIAIDDEAEWLLHDSNLLRQYHSRAAAPARAQLREGACSGAAMRRARNAGDPGCQRTIGRPRKPDAHAYAGT